MEKKHINKRKPFEADDEWSQLGKGVGEKMQEGEVMDIQDRAITFNDEKYVSTKEEDYKIEADEFKDKFGSTAQYVKFVNAHLAEKNNHLNRILADKDKFYEDLAALNPNTVTKEQLDKKNYNKLNVEDVRKALDFVQNERDAIKERIDHFSSQITMAEKQLQHKNKEVDDIKSELLLAESTTDIENVGVDEEKMATQHIQKELKNLASKNESDKIFGAINSLIVLLNSKNESTVNELKSVKNEFNKMKQDYEKVLKALDKKSQQK